MSLKQKIQGDLIDSLKTKKELDVLVLRQLSAAVLNKEKEKRYKLSQKNPEISQDELEKESQLTDEEIMDVIAFEAKKRRESILEFEKGKRQDLVDKETKELKILQRYLPEQLSEDEIRAVVKEAIKKTGAKEQKDMGRVMAELMPRVKGRADGAVVSRIVKELLNF